MKYLLIVAVVLGLCACSEPLRAKAQAFEQISSNVSQDPSSDVELWYPDDMTPLSHVEFRQLALKSNKAGNIQIANGIVVNVADWPATLVSRSLRGPCTSNLIGPTTILTAAHCVDASGEPAGALVGAIYLLKNGGPKEYRIVSCTLHPDYKSAHVRPRGLPRNTKDYAFCELETAVDFIRYETLSSSAISSQASPLMIGWGCTKIWLDEKNRIQADTTDEVSKSLRMGNGSIAATDVTAGLESTGSPGRYLEHRSTATEPTLCPGDSGGPLFTGATPTNQTVPRKIIAVSSAVGGSRTSDGAPIFHSYFASLAAPEFVQFAADYIKEKNVVICGFNRQAGIGGCRG